MKFIFFKFSAVLICLIAFFSVAGPLQAQSVSEYMPDIKVHIGEFTGKAFESGWSEGSCPSGSGAKCVEIAWISQYVGALYRYGIGMAAVLAVIMMMAGGFFWLMSGGSPDKVGKAKDFITSALSGLFLALFSFVLLYTINPRLVAMEPLVVKLPEKVEFSDEPVKTSVPVESSANDKMTEIRQKCETDEELAKYSCYALFGNTRNYQEFGGNEFYFEIPAPSTSEEAVRQAERGESLRVFLQEQTGRQVQLNEFIDYGGLRFRMNADDPANRFWEVRNGGFF